MKIISVVGARPNFIKIAPFIRAIQKYNVSSINLLEHVLVHTGQHYDERMSASFFDELQIPAPAYNLEIGSGSHAQQVGQTMMAFEDVLLAEKPNWVVVVGDVNATLACSVTAKKLNIKVCHIEAGIRSGDMEMPEEINRLVTDSISDLLLTPDTISLENLLKEGKTKKQIHFVGNIMIDSLDFKLPFSEKLIIPEILQKNVINKDIKTDFNEENFGIITLHRPSNVDNKEVMINFLNWIKTKSDENFIWTIHPRTLKQIELFGLKEVIEKISNLILLQPLSYLELLKLNANAKFVLTDSGGLQEECCVLGTPFLVLRKNTERPMTIVENGGIGYLVGSNFEELNIKFDIIKSKKRTPHRPKFWDGHTAERCLELILEA